MTRYTSPRGPKPEDINWLAERLVEYCNKRIQIYKEKGRENYKITTEDIIEIFREMNDDYDDWWARGLYTKEMQKEFVYNLLSHMEKYGISDIEDNTFI